jgi:hypothetical protein
VIGPGRAVLLAAAAAACTSTPAPRPSLYERITARVKRDPQALAPSPPPAGDREKIAALVGRWVCPAHVFATPTTPERMGKEPDRYHFEVDQDGDLLKVDDASPTPWRSVELGWDGHARVWVQPIAQGDGFGMLTSPGWSGSALTLEGRTVIMGEPTQLRTTFRLVDRDHYTLLNEETGIAERPVPLDEYRCERAPER